MNDGVQGRYAASPEGAPGLKMYYEIHGEGRPLVLLHGAYMTIASFGDLLPKLAEHYQVIAVELQGHGHTADIDPGTSHLGMMERADWLAPLVREFLDAPMPEPE